MVLLTSKRIHEQSPAFCQSDDLEVLRQRNTGNVASTAAAQQRLFSKWALIWRSIIKSSFGSTYRPYCHYIRALDFRNLSLLFDDSKFSGTLLDEFFGEGLERLLRSREVIYGRTLKKSGKQRTLRMVDIVPTLNAIGEAVTANTTLLEELAGHLSPGFLTRWISRSPRLQQLVLWTGDALRSGAEAAIRRHCPSFKSLTIWEWLEPNSDKMLAKFFHGVTSNTLEHFEMISKSNLGVLSFNALGHHAQSLLVLKLSSLTRDSVLALGALKECTQIRTLLLHDSQGTTPLEATQNDVFLEVIAWLSDCRELRDLTMIRFWDGPSILAQVLSSPTVHLTKLSLEGYILRDPTSAAFHASLSSQPDLQVLWLKGNGEDANPEDISIMVDSLCQLRNLRDLSLKDISIEFGDAQIVNLAIHLPLLEDFWTTGDEITETVLHFLAGLEHLKNLTFSAITQFNAASILDFIERLEGGSHKGITLSILAADTCFDLPEEEQSLIRDELRTRYDGRFDFALWRDAEADSESDSD